MATSLEHKGLRKLGRRWQLPSKEPADGVRCAHGPPRSLDGETSIDVFGSPTSSKINIDYYVCFYHDRSYVYHNLLKPIGDI